MQVIQDTIKSIIILPTTIRGYQYKTRIQLTNHNNSFYYLGLLPIDSFIKNQEVEIIYDIIQVYGFNQNWINKIVKIQ